MAGKYKMIWKLVVLMFLVLVGSGAARAANNCPWLNEATASGFLSGNAIGTYIPAGQSVPASCTFEQNEAEGTRNLIITVEVVPNPHARLMSVAHGCGANDRPVSAIGNEALRCMVNDRKHNTHSERIIGRVRDQVFSVTLSTTIKQDPALTPEELEMRIYALAEQVSGNLF